MTVFHPSARVRLVIRTEEYADTAALEARLPPQDAGGGPQAPKASPPPPQPPRPASSQEVAVMLTRNEEQLRALARQRPTMPVEDYTAKRQKLLRDREQIRSGALVRVKLASGGVRPDAVGGAADDLTVIGSIQPVSASIERNGLTAPDACNITLNYADAPFDPRSIRSCGVEVLIGIIPPSQVYEGLELGQTRGDGSLVSTIGDQADGSIYGATRFVGFVDEWSVRYSSDGDSVTLECRDMSAPLRDLKLNPGESIDLSVPLTEGIQRLLDSVSPTTAGVVVRWQGEGDPPTPADAAPGRRRARRGRVARRNRSGDEEMTIWDHIVDTCVSTGTVPLVRDFDVVVSEARTMFGTQDALRMVYGKNIESLEFTRRMGGVKVPTIEVRAWDAAIGRTRWARYPVRRGERASGIFGVTNPPRALRANEVTPSGANPTESIRTKIVTHTTDPVVLERIARNAFEQTGRQEIEGQFSTYDVSSYDHDPFEVDLLDARTADPVEVLIVAATSEDSPTSTLAELQAFTRARRRDYLTSLGWNKDVADRFAALQDANGFQSVFRIQDIRVDFDNEDGIKIGVGFINYITVREDA